MNKNLLNITSKLNVLYVEDDEILREKNSNLFNQIFSSVDTGRDGNEGIEKFKEFHKKNERYYDIVITDVQMPKLNGISMAKQILESNNDQVILVLSAYNDSEYLEQFIDLGIDGFIQKPINYNSFIKKIEKAAFIVDGKKQKNEYIFNIDKLNNKLEKEVAQRTQELENLVYTDILTGYGNRYKLNQDIKISTNPALAIVNIDNFSQINDFYGHLKGDKVICRLGEVISEYIKSNSCELYHLQGDEYVIFSKNILQKEFIRIISLLVQELNQNGICSNKDELHIQISSAISFENKENILVTANMARKVAKQECVNFIVYDKSISLEDEYQNNFNWVRKIKKGIGEDRFIPVFQPIVNNKNNLFEKQECLVRLLDEDILLTPANFLNIAKKTKQYTEITKSMLRKSFEAFKDSSIEFSVNLTIEDILNQDINTYIIQLLEEYQIGKRLVFEIVESESIDNFEKVREFIHNVNTFGCKIAIDDFGTGYSNFEYLLRLNADYIKIDGSLIKNIDVNYEAEQVVSTIVDFAKKMGMKTIAEFVENESISKKVKELQIDYSQGYYFGKPTQTIAS